LAPHQEKKRTLCSILVECGIVTSEQVDQALARQIETGRLVGETLVELGFTSEENIGWALSRQLNIPYVDVQPSAVDADLVRRFSEPMLRRIQAVPLYGNQEEIAIAMADPTDAEVIAELGEAIGSTLSLVIGCPASIRRALDFVYGHAGPAPEVKRPEPKQAGDGGPATGGGRADVVWDRTGLSFLLYQLHAARQKRASEIHFVPTKDGVEVSYRTDQGLEPQAVERSETSSYLRSRLAHLGAPDLAGDGEIVASGSAALDVMGERIQLGVCHCRVDLGVTTVLRMSPAPAEAYDLSTLGLSPIGEAEIRDFVDGPEGLVLVYGPPRSGGSTVLASLAALAARPHRRALVLEPARTAPYAPGTTRVQIPATHATPGLWERLAIGLGADIVVLDGILAGEEIQGVLGGATIGRLVFARTDWLDGPRLLSFLSKSGNGRVVLRDRPFAMIALPAARREGSGVWVTPTEAEHQAGILASTILTDEDRDALLAAEA